MRRLLCRSVKAFYAQHNALKASSARTVCTKGAFEGCVKHTNNYTVEHTHTTIVPPAHNLRFRLTLLLSYKPKALVKYLLNGICCWQSHLYGSAAKKLKKSQ